MVDWFNSTNKAVTVTKTLAKPTGILIYFKMPFTAPPLMRKKSKEKTVAPHSIATAKQKISREVNWCAISKPPSQLRAMKAVKSNPGYYTWFLYQGCCV